MLDLFARARWLDSHDKQDLFVCHQGDGGGEGAGWGAGAGDGYGEGGVGVGGSSGYGDGLSGFGGIGADGSVAGVGADAYGGLDSFAQAPGTYGIDTLSTTGQYSTFGGGINYGANFGDPPPDAVWPAPPGTPDEGRESDDPEFAFTGHNVTSPEDAPTIQGGTQGGTGGTQGGTGEGAPVGGGGGLSIGDIASAVTSGSGAPGATEEEPYGGFAPVEGRYESFRGYRYDAHGGIRLPQMAQLFPGIYDDEYVHAPPRGTAAGWVDSDGWVNPLAVAMARGFRDRFVTPEQIIAQFGTRSPSEVWTDLQNRGLAPRGEIPFNPPQPQEPQVSEPVYGAGGQELAHRGDELVYGPDGQAMSASAFPTTASNAPKVGGPTTTIPQDLPGSTSGVGGGTSGGGAQVPTGGGGYQLSPALLAQMQGGAPVQMGSLASGPWDTGAQIPQDMPGSTGGTGGMAAPPQQPAYAGPTSAGGYSLSPELMRQLGMA